MTTFCFLTWETGCYSWSLIYFLITHLLLLFCLLSGSPLCFCLYKTAFNFISILFSRVHVLALPRIPEDPSDDLTDWFSESSSVFNLLKDSLQSFHSKRIQRLNSMQKKSKDLLWWPFTQHNLVPQDSVTVIDSRCGENFSAYKVCQFSTRIFQKITL
jgi:hypothetical protein